MAGWVPPRLRQLLGSDLEGIDLAAVERPIGLPESHDLEYKSEPYPATDGGAKEAAYDLTDLANAGGGLLIIGFEEDGAGVTSGTRAVSTDQDFGLWVDQVVADRIFPSPTVTRRTVTLGSGAIHLLAVPPSLLRPHAVVVGGGALRYPVRSSTTRSTPQAAK
jgi:hypothetical protein